MNRYKRDLPLQQREELLGTLKARFEKNMNRHKGLGWAQVQTKLEADAGKLWSLNEMERTGVEPDVIGYDHETGEYIWCDCSAESPKARRSVCYDREAVSAQQISETEDLIPKACPKRRICNPKVETKIETALSLRCYNALNVGAVTLDDANLLSWFLDPDIQFPNPGTAANAEPLLINTAGSLQYRPEAQIELENLFLASDYVRTYTDIACMEAANEAARRAVNYLLLASGSSSSAAQLWPLEEPGFLKPLQEIDRIRFGLRLPHRLTL